MVIIMEDEMPLLNYFRSLRGKSRRSTSPGKSVEGVMTGSANPGDARDDLLAAQSFYAEQETTRSLGTKKERRGLKKHIMGIFTI